jgi:hypothetical protein
MCGFGFSPAILGAARMPDRMSAQTPHKFIERAVYLLSTPSAALLLYEAL